MNQLNPFIEYNKTQKIENNKNEEDKQIDEYEKFDKFNPFSQPFLNNFLNLNSKNNFFNNKTELSKEEKEKNNSQKKFINSNENVTPTTNDSNIFKINNNISNNIKKDIKIENKQINQNNFIIKDIPQKELNESKIIQQQKKNLNDISVIPKNESNTILVTGKKIFNNTEYENNFLPIYDNQSDIINIENLNKLIEKNQIKEKEKENTKISSPNKIIFNSIDSDLNLGIIKEEPNESEKDIISFKKNNLNINKLINNNNNKFNDLISIDKLLKDQIKNEELDKIVKENSDEIKSLLNNYNNNIINNIIDIDINTFKIQIDKFILESKKIIEKLEIINNIQENIRKKLILNYEFQTKMHEIKLNEYKKLKEYEEKLDYIIYIQNKLIKELEDINNQLTINLNKSKPKNEEIKINENEINKNIENTLCQLDELNKLIKDYNSIENNEKNDIEEINKIDLNDENCLFLDILEEILNPIKNMNKEYQKLILNVMDFEK